MSGGQREGVGEFMMHEQAEREGEEVRKQSGGKERK